ncbi:MAG: right-handed parallel beta-helix repeat-containing protein [Pseudonocardiaceae bacterium]
MKRGVGWVVVGLAFMGGCGGTGEDEPAWSPPPGGASSPPPECTSTVSDPAGAAAAVDQARPGDVVCFTGARFLDLVIEMRASGTAEEPITLSGYGTTLRSIGVSADHVIVTGFVLADGDGLNLRGHGVQAHHNVVRNAGRDGIVCTECVDAVVESNTVWQADGTGIVIEGAQILARHNTVSGSVMREGEDADGFRFFGTGLRLLDNTIRDIKTTDYPEGHAPHTDCFQTYDTRDSRPTYDVVIANNRCENVDVQCLIATSDRTRTTEVPPGVTTILFEGNTCAVNGSQGVLLEYFPNVVVSGNVFSGPRYRAILVSRGSVNGTVVGNTVVGDIPAFEIDDESRRGFHAEGNSPPPKGDFRHGR